MYVWSALLDLQESAEETMKELGRNLTSPNLLFNLTKFRVALPINIFLRPFLKRIGNKGRNILF
jgi:hypothetical protein